MKKYLIVYFIIIEIFAIILYINKEINTYLLILFTLLSTGMIIQLKIGLDKNKDK